MTPATPRVAVAPDPNGSMAEVVRGCGAEVAALDRADALVWTADPRGFPSALPDGVRWVQLPSAGVEQWLDGGIVDRDRSWTSATGAYAAPVAEHALMLLLAGIRRLPACIEATRWTKDDLMPAIGTLTGADVGIIGAGGIARALVPALTALGARTLAVNRTGRPVPGAARTVPATEAEAVWSAADHIVVAAPSTRDTRHLVGERELKLMSDTGWLVNIARGSLVDTTALLAALDGGHIGGAALDVTEPEPLPEGHPLWSHPRVILTPHVANSEATMRVGFQERVRANIERYTAGKPLIGLVDLDAGY